MHHRRRQAPPEFLDVHLAGLHPERITREPILDVPPMTASNGRAKRQPGAALRPIPARRGTTRWGGTLAVVVTVAAFVATGGIGGYLYAHGGDRPSRRALTGGQERAVQHRIRRAVDRAVAAKGATDRRLKLHMLARRLDAQRRADAERARRMLLREQQAGDRRAATAFARGAAVRPGRRPAAVRALVNSPAP